jgi:hypothetical protein
MEAALLKKKVSTGEGWKPRWSTDGTLLYYVTATAIMRVEVREEPSLELGIPTEAASWSDSAKRFEQAGDYSSEYDVAPDGALVVLRKRATEGLPDRIHVEVGWFEELRRKAPPR